MDSSVFDEKRETIPPSVDRLIAKLEATTEGSADLDNEIELAVGRKSEYCDAGGPLDTPQFTASLDAALTLVPDNAWLTLDRYSISDKPGPDPYAWRAWVKWMTGDFDGDGPLYNHKVFSGGRATPSLAVAIAALKARQAVPQTEAGGLNEASNTDNTNTNSNTLHPTPKEGTTDG